MRTKENKTKRSRKNIFAIFLFSIILIMVGIYYIYFTKIVSYASNNENFEKIKISNSKMVDVYDFIIKNNHNKDVTKEEIVEEEEELEYITKYENNSSLPKGTIQVTQEGRNGKQKVYIRKTYNNDEVISEEQIKSTITKSAVNKIVEIGTAGYSSNYKVKVGDTLYVTSDRLSVMLENSEESQKVGTILKNTEVKLLQIGDYFYQINGGGVIGWVNKDSLTYINPNLSSVEIEENYGGMTKSQALKKLSSDMNLNIPSGLSLEQFKKVLNDPKDKNKILYNNAEYFYYAEKQYNINGIFVAAVAIHESNWGTSKIANNKNNLFGYGAYDSSPYNSAYSFTDYSESIDLISRVFVKYYLNPTGTKIYNGEIANGKYYNGNTLSAVNRKYATDKNWANSVYNHIKYLYNKL